MFYKKQEPNIIYRDCKKKTLNQTYREELAKELSERNVQVDQLDLFQKDALGFLNK